MLLLFEIFILKKISFSCSFLDERLISEGVNVLEDIQRSEPRKRLIVLGLSVNQNQASEPRKRLIVLGLSVNQNQASEPR